MRPQTIGRVLGIGVRVAGRAAAKSISSPASPGAVSSAPPARPVSVASSGGPSVADAGRQAVRTAARNSGSVARGLGAFLRPFGRVGGILWLEVTGVFFLLPVLVFTPTVWRTRGSWAHGPDHRTFLVSAIVVVIFLYLGVSSFWRAQRK